MIGFDLAVLHISGEFGLVPLQYLFWSPCPDPKYLYETTDLTVVYTLVHQSLPVSQLALYYYNQPEALTWHDFMLKQLGTAF